MKWVGYSCWHAHVFALVKIKRNPGGGGGRIEWKGFRSKMAALGKIPLLLLHSRSLTLHKMECPWKIPAFLWIQKKNPAKKNAIRLVSVFSGSRLVRNIRMPGKIHKSNEIASAKAAECQEITRNVNWFDWIIYIWPILSLHIFHCLRKYFSAFGCIVSCLMIYSIDHSIIISQQITESALVWLEFLIKLHTCDKRDCRGAISFGSHLYRHDKVLMRSTAQKYNQ